MPPPDGPRQNFQVNTSPLAGKEGVLTSRQIRERRCAS
jgi:predicted membrane GTPase involved in stress response